MFKLCYNLWYLHHFFLLLLMFFLPVVRISTKSSCLYFLNNHSENFVLFPREDHFKAISFKNYWELKLETDPFKLIGPLSRSRSVPWTLNWDSPLRWRSSCWRCCKAPGPLARPCPWAWRRSSSGPASPPSCSRCLAWSSGGSRPRSLRKRGETLFVLRSAVRIYGVV